MQGRKPSREHRISVRCIDMIGGDSLTITVYGAELGDVAAYAAEQLAKRWPTTTLNDGRHKRRR